MLFLTFSTLDTFNIMSDQSLKLSSDPSLSWCHLFYLKGSVHKIDYILYPGSMSQTQNDMLINYQFLKLINLDYQDILIDLNQLHCYLKRQFVSIDQINFIMVRGFNRIYMLYPISITINHGTCSCTSIQVKCAIMLSSHGCHYNMMDN